MTNKHMKRSSTSYVHQEMQTQTMKYYYTSTGMAKLQNADHGQCWQGCGATGPVPRSRWGHERQQALGKAACGFYRTKHTLTVQTVFRALGYLPK